MKYVEEGTLAVMELNEGLKTAEKGRIGLTNCLRKIVLEGWSIDKYGSYRERIGLKHGYTVEEYRIITSDVEAKHLFVIANAAWKPCVEMARDNRRTPRGWITEGRWTNIRLFQRSKGDVQSIERGFEQAKEDWYANQDS